MQSYFTPRPTTAEELKSLYRKLALEHHPDLGGSEQIMKAINVEYEYLFNMLKDMPPASSFSLRRRSPARVACIARASARCSFSVTRSPKEREETMALTSSVFCLKHKTRQKTKYKTNIK